MEALMDGDANRLPEQVAGAAGPTRRGFLEAAGAAAGAALLGGCANQKGGTGEGGVRPPDTGSQSGPIHLDVHAPRATCVALASANPATTPADRAVTSDDSS